MVLSKKPRTYGCVYVGMSYVILNTLSRRTNTRRQESSVDQGDGSATPAFGLNRQIPGQNRFSCTVFCDISAITRIYVIPKLPEQLLK
jgi:hypothetical protein